MLTSPHPKLSQRGTDAPASPFRKLVPFSDEAKKRGVKVYHVNIGDPDFEVADIVQKTLKDLSKNFKHMPYPNARGLATTLEAWVSYYHQMGVELTTNDLMVTVGGSEGLVMATAVTTDPGDEFLVFEPFYANYSSFGTLVSAKPVPVVLDASNGYHLPDDAEVIAKISPRTKAIMFTNPSNPTGTVFTKDEVLRLIALAKKYGLFLISDEAYYGMSFGGTQCYSALQLAQGSELDNVIVIDSVSKKMNACGARIGLIASKNKDVMDAVFRLAQGRLCAPRLEQLIMEPLIKNSHDYTRFMTEQYEKRRDVFLQELEDVLDIKIHRPEGAFYAMVTLPVDDTEVFAKWLLTDFSDNNETVMVAPGRGFYATPGKGQHEVRVAYVLKEQDLKRAAELLGLAVKAYNSR